MHVVSGRILGLVLALSILGAPTLLATPAYAGVNYDDTPVGCGLNPDDIGVASGNWGSSAYVETQNDNQFCYYITVGGHFKFANGSYLYLNPAANWYGGYIAGISWPETGNIVEAAGSHNACEAGWTGCNGYTGTLAYQ